MLIKFKLEDYEEICDEYAALFEREEVVEVINTQDLLLIRTRRIVVPDLHVSFREAEWYVRNNDIDDPDDEDAWELQCSIFVQYAEDERAVEKYISFTTCDLANCVSELVGTLGKDQLRAEQLDCYIDTCEFIDDEQPEEPGYHDLSLLDFD